MPEGPSIVILKETVSEFTGKKVVKAEGYAKIDLTKISGKKITSFRSWGKHFLICFKGFFLRVHLMMFGTYRLNERKANNPALSLQFKNGELNFYTCSVKLISGDPSEQYDWSADVMSPDWDSASAMKKLKASKDLNICDALLDQTIFSGVGNIIKNEVLFRIHVHPASIISQLPLARLKALVKEAVNYSWDFYHWKKAFVLKKHWLIYKKQVCPRCAIAITKNHIGKTKRLTCYCENCQVLYN
jgi:endonuclease VIII